MITTPAQSDALTHHSTRITHGFFNRNQSLDQDMVKLGAARLASVHQVHSADVVIITEDRFTLPPKADAMVTSSPNVALGIITADCGPVLFADMERGIIGAAHAGWRGALAGVLGNTVQAMEDLGSRRENISAALGPCIHQSSYQVGQELKDAFLNADSHAATCFTPDPSPCAKNTKKASESDAAIENKYLFDLPGYILSKLSQLDLNNIGWVPHNTYSDQQYCSYRQATHEGRKSDGRQMSAIALLES